MPPVPHDLSPSTFPHVMNDGSGALFGTIFFVVYFGIIAVLLASLWKLFSKAGKPGWAGIIPIYNIVVLLQIVGRPVWWIIGLFLPVVNIIVPFIIGMDLARSFGKSQAYGIGLVLLGIIFVPMLAFGDAEYQGPSASQGLLPNMSTA
jgi:hypothetical protein